MIRKLAIGIAVMGLLVSSVPVMAGGWAVVTLDALPTGVVANRPFTVGFVLRQHGQTMLGHLAGQVIFENDKRETVTANVADAGAYGHYTATVSLPKAGVWKWRITIFGEHPMPPLTVQARTQTMPGRTTPAQQVALGKDLFVAKGCSSCHVHGAILGSGSFSNAYGGEGAPDLTTVKYDAAYLHTWLKDPKATKPKTMMPNLGLKQPEIDALTAFLMKK